MRQAASRTSWLTHHGAKPTQALHTTKSLRLDHKPQNFQANATTERHLQAATRSPATTYELAASDAKQSPQRSTLTLLFATESSLQTAILHETSVEWVKSPIPFARAKNDTHI